MLNFRCSVTSGLCFSPSLGEEHGLVSWTVAGNRAYGISHSQNLPCICNKLILISHFLTWFNDSFTVRTPRNLVCKYFIWNKKTKQWSFKETLRKTNKNKMKKKKKTWLVSKQEYLFGTKCALDIVLRFFVARRWQFSESENWGKLWSSILNGHCQIFASVFDIYKVKIKGFVLNIKIILSAFKNSATLFVQHTNVSNNLERMTTKRLMTIQNLC